jgi:quercetin dioxygenase-like cupin family protein
MATTSAKVFQLADLPVDRVGSTYRMAALGGDDATVGLHWFEPDHPPWPAPHSHPYDQLAFVLQGAMRFTLGDETRDVVGPAVVWIPADMPHSADVIGDEPCFNLDVFGLVREDFSHLFPGDDAAAHVVPFEPAAADGATA